MKKILTAMLILSLNLFSDNSNTQKNGWEYNNDKKGSLISKKLYKDNKLIEEINFKENGLILSKLFYKNEKIKNAIIFNKQGFKFAKIYFNLTKETNLIDFFNNIKIDYYDKNKKIIFAKENKNVKSFKCSITSPSNPSDTIEIPYSINLKKNMLLVDNTLLLTDLKITNNQISVSAKSTYEILKIISPIFKLINFSNDEFVLNKLTGELVLSSIINNQTFESRLAMCPPMNDIKVQH